MFGLYEIIALELLPHYPVTSNATKKKIAKSAAFFISNQLALQPKYILYPLSIVVFLLAISIRLFGSSSLVLWRKLPAGKMIERLLRSLVTIKFFENDEVLAILNEKTGRQRVEFFRAKRNA